MKLIFEIRDLKFATPATATRAGILFISENKQWHSMVCVRGMVHASNHMRAAKVLASLCVTLPDPTALVECQA